jgi:hypothetical protein
MSSRSVSDMQTRAEGESLYIRYRSDANVLSYLKNDPSYEFIGEVILKINILEVEKIKAEVYVNQDKSVSDSQTWIKHSFILYFPRELLMNFLKLFMNVIYEKVVHAGTTFSYRNILTKNMCSPPSWYYN